MRSFKHFLFLVVIGAIFLLLTSLSPGAEFTAKVVTVYPDQKPTGKVYVKGDKKRNEVKYSKFEPSAIYILRPDKKLLWMILPKFKTYAEVTTFIPRLHIQMMPYTPEQVKARMKKVGTEVINGYECDKFESKSPSGNSLHIWIAKKLEVPIKIMAEDGSFSTEYSDIKQEKLDDSLFELPPGYRKMKFP